MPDVLRIRGQEVEIRVTRNKLLIANLTAVKSFTFTAHQTILSEGYLGETTNRRDDIFTGCGIVLEFHPESRDHWDLIRFIRDRASRRSSAQQAVSHINAVFTGNFPNGDRPKITTPDLKFGDLPITAGGRETYVAQTLTAECDDFIYTAA
jgi:hypothetical protein